MTNHPDKWASSPAFSTARFCDNKSVKSSGVKGGQGNRRAIANFKKLEFFSAPSALQTIQIIAPSEDLRVPVKRSHAEAQSPQRKTTVKVERNNVEIIPAKLRLLSIVLPSLFCQPMIFWQNDGGRTMKTNTDSAFLSTLCASVFQRSSSASFAPLRETGFLVFSFGCGEWPRCDLGVSNSSARSKATAIDREGAGFSA